GEGGALYTDNLELFRIIESLKDWGRDCHCKTGEDNLCGQRFTGQYGELPYGYDHKYVFSQFGYNLKATEMQAAIGIEQLKKLPGFVEKRRENWNTIYEGLKPLAHALLLPEILPDAKHSPFGLVLSVKPEAGFDRNGITAHLESKNIQTRTLFAGNIIKHPCFDEMRKEKRGYREVGDMTATDAIMFNTFWIGVYPGLSKAQIDYMIKTITEYVTANE
ncbi:MAG: DegT/DnrJ/EryC1/StrS family aminotransferase, partial [Eubacteriales bacterium]